MLRSLPLIFDAKISSMEEGEDLYELTMAQVNGILMTYEMRTEKGKPSMREVSFKISKKIKNREQRSRDSSTCDLDIKEAHFSIFKHSLCFRHEIQ